MRWSTRRSRVIVGISGGVDSAVAALRLLEQGHDVQGMFMKNWEEDDDAGHCAAAEDLAAARAACDTLGISLHTVNFSHEYWTRVFEHFLHEYRAGRTPNPDVLCNSEVKFRAFLDHALGLGAERIATGHYARIDVQNGGAVLRKAADTAKDQTYFLHALGQDQLRNVLFPLGDLTKARVRSLARDAGLPNSGRRDSTGICFIGERPFREFLGRYLPAQPGEICTLSGEPIGNHQGLMFHTLGQRRGLGIGGLAGREGAAWYVAVKDIRRNRLIVVPGHDHPALYRETLLASGTHWISGRAPTLPLACAAKVRYRQDEQPCTIEDSGDGRLQVRFLRPQRAVTPGQSVVFYEDDRCLGGGVICDFPNDGTE